jgi:hypothetical protein
VKKILIGLGSIFAALVVFAIVMGISSARFKSQQTPFGPECRLAVDLHGPGSSYRWSMRLFAIKRKP